MRLSPHFTLTEATKSQTASRLGIDNTPSAEEIERMKALCDNVLEPVRMSFGKPVIVHSFYRSSRLNAEIGSKPSSSHVRGEAADIEIASVPNLELADWILKNVPFDQLILEYNTAGPNSGWVHVSYSKDICRSQCLRIDAAGTRLGLV